MSIYGSYLFALFLYIYYNRVTIYKEGIDEKENFITISTFDASNTNAVGSCWEQDCKRG